jgi:DNA-binding transcriptional LysR family regulator
MDKFLQMQTFASVVDAGSFVRAAESLDMSKAAVSRYVADLEERLGVRLLHRTTRKLSLTEEGRAFHARCKALLGELEEAESEITARSAQASGLVKINVPVSFGIRHLAPLWSDFMAQNPKVTLDVTLADRVVDLVEEGYDLAVRIGSLADSTLVSRKLASTRMVLCASPDYLKKHGMPRTPADIANHTVLAYSLQDAAQDLDGWLVGSPALTTTSTGITLATPAAAAGVALAEDAAVRSRSRPRPPPAGFGRGVIGAAQASSMWRDTGPVTSSMSAWRGLATKRMPRPSML